MGSFSDEFEVLVLDHIFKNASLGQATNLFVALSKSTLSDTCFGTNLAGELSGDGYARVTCDTWDAAAAGATENTQPVTFAQATADWGVVVAWAVCDHASTGNVVVFGSLNTTKNIQSGDTAKFATGDIDITLT